MGKDKLPRIPSFAELGISENEIEELEREIADEVAARKRRETGKGAPVEGPRSGASGSSSPGPGRAAGSPGTEPGRKQEITRAERKRQARQARRAERQQKAQAAREAKRAMREDLGGTAEHAADSEPHPTPAPWSGLRGPLSLVVLLFTAWFSSSYRSIPGPVEVSAPDSVFSSGRAMSHLVRIASEARPPGSPAHARVREYLLDELRALGHEPTVQTSTSLLAAGRTRAATIRNVLARIPGSEPGGRAVLVTAHYDSREIALGAGDDGSGVVTILEALRALGVRGQLRNDLIVLITDAEELGLLGARAFVDEHPWMDDVAVVVSIEMRGGGGPSMMFETGEDNGWVIEQLRQADPYPAANSVSYEIYLRMPNDTDFTLFKEAGRQGLNFAAVGRPHVYHQVYDSPGNLSEATVQHHGEHALAMLQHFGNADLIRVDAPNVSYISVPYLGLVTYGTPWIWVLGIFAVLLWLAVLIAGRRFGARIWAVVVGLLGSVVYLAMSGALAWYLFEWRSGAHPEMGALQAGTFHAEGWYVLAIVCAALALAAVVAGVLRVWLTAAELAAGALIVPVGLAATATVMFPMAAMNLQWPAIAGCVGALAVVGLARRQRMGFLRWVVVLVAAIPVVVVLTPLTESVWAAMGLELAAGLAVLMGIAFVALVPALDVLREPNGWWAPVGVLMAGGAFLAVGMSTATPSADRPAPSTLVYALNQETGSAWWGTDPSRGESDPGVAWASVVVGPFGEASAPDVLGEFTPGPIGYAVAQAEAVDAPLPAVTVVADSGGTGDALRLAVTSSIGAEMMLFRFGDDGMRPTAVNGRELPAGARSTSVEHWGTPEAGVLLDFPRVPGGDLLSFTIVEHHLRPGELVGADRFRRPAELAPNIRTLSDRAMIRTRVTVNPVTGEVRFASAAGPVAEGVSPDEAKVEGGPEQGGEVTPEGDSTDVVGADTAQADTTGTAARDTIPPGERAPGSGCQRPQPCRAAARSPFQVLKHITSSNRANGKPVMSAAVWSATSPPLTRSVIATIPSKVHQKTRSPTGVSIFPPAVIVSITSEPESEEVTKKTATSTMAIPDVMAPSGSASSSPNRASSSWPDPTASTTSVWPPSMCMDSAVAPNALNQSAERSTGTSSMQPTSWRTVRPRETRAMNSPTNGDQESHHAQVEGGPPVHEVEVVTPDPTAERGDGDKIVTDAGDEPREHVEGRPHRQHEREQQQGQKQVGLAQALDPPVHSGHDRYRGDGRDRGDNQHLGRVGGRHTEQMGQPRRQLFGAQPERGRQPEKRGEDGQDVDTVA